MGDKPPQSTTSSTPTLDQFKAQLASMTPEQRKQAIAVWAELVKKQLQGGSTNK